MIALLFGWAASGFVVGYLDGSHDVRVIAWILLAMALVAWLVNSLYTGWLTNRNASATLELNEERRRAGGAL